MTLTCAAGRRWRRCAAVDVCRHSRALAGALRGSNTWRQTLVSAGESYTINLVGEEDGAMIETPNNTTPFSLTLQNCTPQPLTP